MAWYCFRTTGSAHITAWTTPTNGMRATVATTSHRVIGQASYKPTEQSSYLPLAIERRRMSTALIHHATTGRHRLEVQDWHHAGISKILAWIFRTSTSVSVGILCVWFILLNNYHTIISTLHSSAFDSAKSSVPWFCVCPSRHARLAWIMRRKMPESSANRLCVMYNRCRNVSKMLGFLAMCRSIIISATILAINSINLHCSDCFLA